MLYISFSEGGGEISSPIGKLFKGEKKREKERKEDPENWSLKVKAGYLLLIMNNKTIKADLYSIVLSI